MRKHLICISRGNTHNVVINNKFAFEEFKTGAKGINILSEPLLAFASDITSETQIEGIRCILISALKTAPNTLIMATEKTMFLYKNKTEK